MKVTAIIPDNIVKEVNILSKGETITQSLITALSEWISIKKISALNKKVQKNPLQFSDSFSANKIRALNRR